MTAHAGNVTLLLVKLDIFHSSIVSAFKKKDKVITLFTYNFDMVLSSAKGVTPLLKLFKIYIHTYIL